MTHYLDMCHITRQSHGELFRIKLEVTSGLMKEAAFVSHYDLLNVFCAIMSVLYSVL